MWRSERKSPNTDRLKSDFAAAGSIAPMPGARSGSLPPYRNGGFWLMLSRTIGFNSARKCRERVFVFGHGIAFSTWLRGKNLPGFTLLELLLALLLSGFVLIAVAMTVDLHLRVVHLGRHKVEEAQLARVILQRMADDIRAAIPYHEPDLTALTTGLQQLSSESLALLTTGGWGEGASQSGSSRSSSSGGSSGSSGSSSGTSSGALQGSSGSSTSGTEEGATEDESEESETIELGTPRSIPGLYGGPDWLQVDVSRLPRPDQFALTEASGEGELLADRLSDVKTVLYGLLVPGSTMASSQTNISGLGWGLYRREVDRAVGSLASEQNALDQAVIATGPLAPEVVSLEFWYFDGSQWLDSWDSEEQGSLPVAVEIIIGINKNRASLTESVDTMLQSTEEVALPETLYRMVVWLPAGKAAGEEQSEIPTESTGSTE